MVPFRLECVKFKVCDEKYADTDNLVYMSIDYLMGTPPCSTNVSFLMVNIALYILNGYFHILWDPANPLYFNYMLQYLDHKGIDDFERGLVYRYCDKHFLNK